MRYRSLGTGPDVSVVGLGCNEFGGRLDVTATRAVVDAALDAGVNLLDTADVYGGHGASESALGEVLSGRRDRVVLATKFGNQRPGYGDLGYGDLGPRGGRRYIRHAVAESLRRLRTDRIDLYQIHQPDPSTPIEETLGALHELVVEGAVLQIGHSNFDGPGIAAAASAAAAGSLTPFVSAQNHWSLLERSVESTVVPAAIEHGLGVLPYYPLASGLLTGKIRRGVPAADGTRLAGRAIPSERLDAVESLSAWASSRGRTLLEVAIGGLAALPGCASVIAGATSADQVRANAAAASWEPTADELAALDAIVRPGTSVL